MLGRTADLYGRRRVCCSEWPGLLYFLCSWFEYHQVSWWSHSRAAGTAAAFMAPTALSICWHIWRRSERQSLSVWSSVASGGAAAGVSLAASWRNTSGWDGAFCECAIEFLQYLDPQVFPAHIQEAKDKSSICRCNLIRADWWLWSMHWP